jgi:hypothetical protein
MEQISKKSETKKNATQGVIGMSLRDFLAAQAMNGLLSKSHPEEWIDPQKISIDAYAIADFMIKISHR